MINNWNAIPGLEDADFIAAADISILSDGENRGYPRGIVVGIALSQPYIMEVTNKDVDNGEFTRTEKKAEQLAMMLAAYLEKQGYSSFAQTEENMVAEGLADEASLSMSLPCKTIAVLTGVGWIGKNNLLITEKYGSALCMCSVLTDAPADIREGRVMLSRCREECSICKSICPPKALHGCKWEKKVARDQIVDVHKCKCCLKCMMFCPWTQAYGKKLIIK